MLWMKGLWWKFLDALKDTSGEDKKTVTEAADEDTDVDTDTDESQDTDTDEDTEDADSDVGQTDGNKPGDRSKYIPRDRVDQMETKYKTKLQKYEKLKEMGILVDGEDGEIHLNQEVLKSKKVDAKDIVTLESLRFTKDEVHADSWPIVDKINKALDYFGKEMSVRDFHVQSLYAENAILREWPEFLQKDSPLRKKAMEILKSDPEFKTTYKGNPLKNFFAVKRAAESLANKTSKPKPKKKPSFIVGKGDTGGVDKGGKGKSIEDMTAAELDALEKKEHDRLFKTNKGKI